MNKLEAQVELQKLQTEAQLKFQLMQAEVSNISMQLKSLEVQALKTREDNKEDRKDERTRIQASQQSELISQRKEGSGPLKSLSLQVMIY